MLPWGMLAQHTPRIIHVGCAAGCTCIFCEGEYRTRENHQAMGYASSALGLGIRLGQPSKSNSVLTKNGGFLFSDLRPPQTIVHQVPDKSGAMNI